MPGSECSLTSLPSTRRLPGDRNCSGTNGEAVCRILRNPCLLPLLPIRDRFAALFQRARDDQNAGCQTDYVHAAIIADQMMSNASELRGLHGDLHHENIMFSSRGWLVIDPVGLVGEVGFGAANMFYDPADRDDLCLDPRRIAQMADAFLSCAGRRSASPARPGVRLWVPFRSLERGWRRGATRSSYRGRDQAGATDVILDIKGHCCKVSDEAAFCLIQRPYISKTLLTRRISPRGITIIKC